MDEANVEAGDIIYGLRERLSRSVYSNCILEARVARLQAQVQELTKQLNGESELQSDEPVEKGVIVNN